MKTVAKMIVWFSFTAGGVLFADTLDEGKKAFQHHDYLLAVENFSRSCDAGNALGCFELGLLNEQGIGTAQNKYAAQSLYARACTLGYPKGCANMGVGYDTP